MVIYIDLSAAVQIHFSVELSGCQYSLTLNRPKLNHTDLTLDLENYGIYI